MMNPVKYPKWMQEPSTRKRSDKQESRIAKRIGGKKRINSGATFKQNDVFSTDLDVEAKLTSKKSFSVTEEMWQKLTDRTDTTRMSVIVVEFEQSKKQLAVVDFDELMFLVEQLRKNA